MISHKGTIPPFGNIWWGPGCGFSFFKNLAALVLYIINCKNSSNIDGSYGLTYENTIHENSVFRSKVNHAHFVLGLCIFQDLDLSFFKSYNIPFPEIYQGNGYIIPGMYFDQLAFHHNPQFLFFPVLTAVF